MRRRLKNVRKNILNNSLTPLLFFDRIIPVTFEEKKMINSRRPLERIVEFGALALLSLTSLCVALIPVWIICLARILLAPAGFWQNFIIFGCGLYLLGGLQFVCIIVWLFFISKLWLD
mgnify:FL=1